MINCVKRWRQFEGYSQEMLALLTGLSRMTITDIETNETIPKLDTALKIANALNRPVDSLFCLDDEEPPEFKWVRPGLIREA